MEAYGQFGFYISPQFNVDVISQDNSANNSKSLTSLLPRQLKLEQKQLIHEALKLY